MDNKQKPIIISISFFLFYYSIIFILLLMLVAVVVVVVFIVLWGVFLVHYLEKLKLQMLLLIPYFYSPKIK